MSELHQKPYRVPHQVESHSSYLFNRSVVGWSGLIRMEGKRAMDTMHYEDIKSYYNAIYIQYINGVSAILNPEDFNTCEQIIERYSQKLIEINEDGMRTRKELQELLELVTAFNHVMMRALQKLQYLFRTGSRQLKGLKNIPWDSEGGIYQGRTRRQNDGDFSEREV